MPRKNTHTFTVTIESEKPRDYVREMLEILINAGLEDAHDTASGDFGPVAMDEANDAINMNISISE